MPKLTIDNREIEVPAGTKVIEAAERLGIMIPRFCFHPALGAVGACRVCAVAFMDGPVKGIQMSCMVNAQDAMVVSTTDDEAVDFRRHVIEWLMLHHPHDCPVCDEGGHCLLQDLTVSGGHGMRRYQGLKRTYKDQYLGPLIQHEMNRCIQCYRCARYYQEFSGAKDLGVMGIGSRVYFGRSQPGILESSFSGNLIDICPTGVYTDKPSRFIGRRWDFERAPSICLHCSLGCNLVASARYRQVVRHEARPNLDVNGHFICDRGRFGYAYADSEDRPRHALAKGMRRTMPTAQYEAKAALADVVRQHGPQSVAAAGSVRCSLETLALLESGCRQHQWRGPAVAHDLRKAGNLKSAVGSLDADLAVSLGAISVAEFVLVIGADPINEAPMLALSLRQAQRQGGHIAVIDPRAVKLPLAFDHLPVSPNQLSAVVNHLMDAVCGVGGTARSSAADEAMAGVPKDRLEAITSRLCGSQRAVIVCGTDITTSDEIGRVAALARVLRKAGTEAKLFYPLIGPNAFAAGRIVDDAQGIEGLLDQIETGQVKALVAVETDLWHNYPDRRRLMGALDRLALFVLLDHVDSPLVAQADYFLPTQNVYEAGGHWINQEGRLQYAEPVLAGGTAIESVSKGQHPPRIFESTIPDSAPTAAWVLLTDLIGSEGRGPAAAMEQAAAILGQLEAGRRISMPPGRGAPDTDTGPLASESDTAAAETLSLLLVDWTFGTEGLSAGSPALVEVTPAPVATLHPETARYLSLVDGGRMILTTAVGKMALACRTDTRMAPNVIVIPRHHLLAWQALGATRLKLSPDAIRAEK